MSVVSLDDKKVFEVHLDALKDAYKELIETNQKLIGILLIVFAWFVTNSNPLSILSASRPLFALAIVATCFGYAALAYLFGVIVRRGRSSFRCLVALGYPKELFSRYEVTWAMYACGLIGQFCLLTGILASIYIKYR